MADQDPAHSVLALTQAIGPAAGFLARQLFDQAARDACQRCLVLLSYARSFTPIRVERAALRLMDYGIHELDALRFLLEHDLDALAPRADAEFDGQLALGIPGAASSQRT